MRQMEKVGYKTGYVREIINTLDLALIGRGWILAGNFSQFQ